MHGANGSSRHLSQAGLTGPAERTIVEPWLSELTRLPLNAYDEPPAAGPAEGRVVAFRRGVRPLGHPAGSLAVA
ncbi:hypothetical protein [Actinomadura harenae]|uniref:Uncharacterized protein n=1 Tax=Actinomadura harenae TaxID=2483351 RepID=A0A3M2LYC0_9ACTN|nr:hypothetical protein [Actinomadura harenae]RMI42212.1 hypothetical protein EBO15_20535 [Actinomadura harenae]